MLDNMENETVDSLCMDIKKKPIYCGKLAYGRKKNEKAAGTRDEYYTVTQEKYMLNDGIHEAIISEDDWKLAHQKRIQTGASHEKAHSLEHEYI